MPHNGKRLKAVLLTAIMILSVVAIGATGLAGSAVAENSSTEVDGTSEDDKSSLPSEYYLGASGDAQVADHSEAGYYGVDLLTPGGDAFDADEADQVLWHEDGEVFDVTEDTHDEEVKKLWLNHPKGDETGEHEGTVEVYYKLNEVGDEKYTGWMKVSATFDEKGVLESLNEEPILPSDSDLGASGGDHVEELTDAGYYGVDLLTPDGDAFEAHEADQVLWHEGGTVFDVTEDTHAGEVKRLWLNHPKGDETGEHEGTVEVYYDLDDVEGYTGWMMVSATFDEEGVLESLNGESVVVLPGATSLSASGTDQVADHSEAGYYGVDLLTPGGDAFDADEANQVLWHEGGTVFDVTEDTHDEEVKKLWLNHPDNDDIGEHEGTVEVYYKLNEIGDEKYTGWMKVSATFDEEGVLESLNGDSVGDGADDGDDSGAGDDDDDGADDSEDDADDTDDDNADDDEADDGIEDDDSDDGTDDSEDDADDTDDDNADDDEADDGTDDSEDDADDTDDDSEEAADGTDDGVEDDDSDDGDEDGQPGFGVAVAIVALLGAAMLALRRQN